MAAGEGVTLRVLDRGSHALAYAKGAEPIEDVLAAAGASNAVLAFEEQAVMGATPAHANRLANADHANLVRTSRAAHAQLARCARSRRRASSTSCRRACARPAACASGYPTLSLRELAARCDPPATKAAVVPPPHEAAEARRRREG